MNFNLILTEMCKIVISKNIEAKSLKGNNGKIVEYEIKIARIFFKIINLHIFDLFYDCSYH